MKGIKSFQLWAHSAPVTPSTACYLICQPGAPMRVYFNGLWTPSLVVPRYRVSLNALALGLLTVALTLVVLAQPWSTQIVVGGGFDGPFLRDFYAAEHTP